MDAVFAILVFGAVIFFGALISAGNERQRKALEGIKEQTAQWAMQDLRLKREKLAREVKVDDPVAWLNQVMAKVYGQDLGLTVTEVFDNPKALVCTSIDGYTVVFSPLSPSDIQRAKSRNLSKLTRLSNRHPLMNLASNTKNFQASILNCSVLFDLELSIVWMSLTNLNTDSDKLWIYLRHER